MTIDYAPLGARARGLALHLCSRDELERWAALAHPAALGHALEARHHLATPLPTVPAAGDIEEAQRRTVAARLTTLARWAGPANPVLDAFDAEQERRSLRALVRGAVEGAPPATRLAGLLPTPRLPVRLLAELAAARSAREIALRLFVLRDAHAAPLVALTAQAHLDLLDVEVALARVLAERLRDAARRGDAALRELITLRIDLVNAQSALELVGAASDFAPSDLFVAGGCALDHDSFVAVAGAASRTVAAARIARAFAGTPWAGLFAAAPEDPARRQADAHAHTIAALRRRGRVDPLGSAPVQVFLARLDAESADIRRLAWGLELGVPGATLREGLVTPWT